MGRLAVRLAEVTALHGRVQGAAKLAQMLKDKTLPQACPAAFELPLGITGNEPTAAGGMFVQPIGRVDGVLLVVRSVDDRTGEKAMVQLDPLIEEVIAAIAGWGPDDMPGVYQLMKGELASVADGVVAYQLDFSIFDQLRFNR